MSNKKEKNQAEFKKTLALILANLQDEGTKDDETVWLTGSLAARLLDKADRPSWTKLKIALSDEAYDNLLKSFQEQGNALFSEGKEKAAYAIQTLACSVIGARLKDKDIESGTQLLDQFIDASINFYRHGMSQNPPSASNGNTVN